MDLRDRLRLLKAAGASRGSGAVPSGSGAAAPVSAGPSAAAAAPAPATPSGNAPEPGAMPRDGGPVPAVAGGCLEGFTVATGAGEAFYMEARYPLDHCRGPLPLSAIFAVPGSAWQVLGRVPADADLRQAAFFDTETTGLAGGTGTHAFLVGLGFFEGHSFVVRQYFLRDYPEEDALLEALGADLRRFRMLVSFNGKSFDWPLMETRFRLARRRVPLAGEPHLDLLHPSRRIWRDRLGQCNLTNLESQVLAVTRQGDVPGSLIPPLYFDYLRSGNAAPLQDVVVHNRLDIVSLVALAAWLGRIVSDPFSPTPDGELVCGDDLFALGRLFEARGLQEDCLACLEAAYQRGVSAISLNLVRRELARVYKRVRQHDRALALWTEMLEQGGELALHPHLELAKYYEHVARDYHLAHQMATRALDVLEHRRALGAGGDPGVLRDREALRHRLQRLDRKLGE